MLYVLQYINAPSSHDSSLISKKQTAEYYGYIESSQIDALWLQISDAIITLESSFLTD